MKAPKTTRDEIAESAIHNGFPRRGRRRLSVRHFLDRPTIVRKRHRYPIDVDAVHQMEHEAPMRSASADQQPAPQAPPPPPPLPAAPLLVDEGLWEHAYAYALLVTPGLEAVAAASLEAESGLVLPQARLVAPAPPQVAAGFAAGAAGGVSPLLVGAHRPLMTALGNPTLLAALALVLCQDVVGLESATAAEALGAVARALTGDRAESSQGWSRALRTWRVHVADCKGGGGVDDGGNGSRNGSGSGSGSGGSGGCGNGSGRSEGGGGSTGTCLAAPNGEDAGAPLRLRVAVLRGGEHAISSPEIAAEIAQVVLTWQPSWTVDLDAPEITLVGVLVQRRLLLGLVLPPWEARRTSVLPPETRPWLLHGLSRAHMRPSRAATMVRSLRRHRPSARSMQVLTTTPYLLPHRCAYSRQPPAKSCSTRAAAWASSASRPHASRACMQSPSTRTQRRAMRRAPMQPRLVCAAGCVKAPS